MDGPAGHDVTHLLGEASRGNRGAFDELFPLVYDELRRIAQANLERERDDHTLSATSLVHEAYLRLVQQDRATWNSRLHFFAVSATAMRRILVDYARARNRTKRGGRAVAVDIESMDLPARDALTESDAINLVMLDDVLCRLAEFNPAGAQVVEYRFFAGLTIAEIATVQGTSEMTVRRRWMAAKTWLRTELAPVEFESPRLSSDA